MTQNFFIPALNFLKRIHVPVFNLGTFSKYPWFKIRTQFSASKSDVFDGHTDRDTGPQCHHIDLKPWCHISLVWRQRARCHRPGLCLIYWDDTLICTVPVILTPGSLAQTSALNQMIIISLVFLQIKYVFSALSKFASTLLPYFPKFKNWRFVWKYRQSFYAKLHKIWKVVCYVPKNLSTLIQFLLVVCVLTVYN